jgi:D-alanyl-lipoteichoic acid acyltransferase DltB (MBOAT superfamily)
MSYSLDVYRGRMSATRDLVAFMAYVAFFPQLVAGPIERARRLLPQFTVTRAIGKDALERGVWLILWGLFKKVALADNLAYLVEVVYASPGMPGPMVLLGTLAFAFQIYCDFSGYSDIARGIASVLGFDIMVNFNLPYAALNLREFWRRWHISLSTWLRDYLYISLGGNRRGRARTGINIAITMLLGGLWHGAAWHFVAWGAWHAAGLLAHRVWAQRWSRPRPRLHVVGWALAMLFVLYGWLLFRADSMGHALAMTRALFTFGAPAWLGDYLVCLLVYTVPLVVVQVWQYRTGDLLAPLRLPGWGKALVQGALLLAILLFWERDMAPFIYFQF